MAAGGGAVVNFTSISSRVAQTGRWLYPVSKAAMAQLTRNMAMDLAGDRIRRAMGIVNGTTNYILTRMTEAGQSFADALAEAQALGYAEADPTADVEGHDAAAKAAIRKGSRVTCARMAVSVGEFSSGTRMQEYTRPTIRRRSGRATTH